MDTQTLQAEVREGSGKGPARQLRAKGLIPAVFYGPGVNPTQIAVSPKELRKALGTAAQRENSAVAVQGDIDDRVADWLSRRGATRITRG